MSRGPGRLQRALFATIRQNGKPMTFDDIRAIVNRDTGAEPNAKLSATFERSLRRALHKMTDDAVLIAIGDGGPGDPLRYFLHPMLIAIVCDEPEADALWQALKSDSGAAEAVGQSMAKQSGADPVSSR